MIVRSADGGMIVRSADGGMIVRSAGVGMIVRSAGGGMIVRSAEESDELLDEFPLVVVESVDRLLFRTTFLVLAIYQ